MFHRVYPSFTPYTFFLDKLTCRLPVCCRPHMIPGTTVAMKADVDKQEDGILNTGDTIEYRLRVANSGNTCLTDVVLRDKDNGIIPCDDSYTGKMCCIDRVPQSLSPFKAAFTSGFLSLVMRSYRPSRNETKARKTTAFRDDSTSSAWALIQHLFFSGVVRCIHSSHLHHLSQKGF